MLLIFHHRLALLWSASSSILMSRCSRGKKKQNHAHYGYPRLNQRPLLHAQKSIPKQVSLRLSITGSVVV